MKYLIIECKELGDQWECDADRTPICITENHLDYGFGYEVWKILEDGNLEKIRDYDDPLEEGMALYYWENEEDVENKLPIILEKYPDKDRDAFSKEFFQKIKTRVGFSEVASKIKSSIHCAGSYAENIQGKWVVFGEYRDNIFDYGY